MFEFSLAIILRQRQVQLTKQFVQSAERGGGECAQMLMGEGKTTVVCPLLGYLLATDTRMVCQVVPHALLEFREELYANPIQALFGDQWLL